MSAVTPFADDPDDESNDDAEALVHAAGRRPFAIPDLKAFHTLRILAESYADNQDHRQRVMNRLGLKADGTPQTSGARVSSEYFAGQVEANQQAEHLSGLALVRAYRRVTPPGIVEWQRSTFGIGEHLLARLLGATGHPRIATPSHWEGTGTARSLVADAAFERTLRQLWAYCGHGDPARKLRKGMTAEELFTLGSPAAKMLVHLSAEAAMKTRLTVDQYEELLDGCDTDAGRAYIEEQLTKLRTGPPLEQTVAIRETADGADPSPDLAPIVTTKAITRTGEIGGSTTEPNEGTPAREGTVPSPDPPTAGREFIDGQEPSLSTNAKLPTAPDRRYRRHYDLARVKYADRSHADPCVRCGPSGKPAEAGSPWSPAHQHAAALRLVGKEILRDLWNAAR